MRISTESARSNSSLTRRHRAHADAVDVTAAAQVLGQAARRDPRQQELGRDQPGGDEDGDHERDAQHGRQRRTLPSLVVGPDRRGTFPTDEWHDFALYVNGNSCHRVRPRLSPAKPLLPGHAAVPAADRRSVDKTARRRR